MGDKGLERFESIFDTSSTYADHPFAQGRPKMRRSLNHEQTIAEPTHSKRISPETRARLSQAEASVAVRTQRGDAGKPQYDLRVCQRRDSRIKVCHRSIK